MDGDERMKRIRVLAFICVLMVVPALAYTLDFFGQSRSFLQSRESADSKNLLTLYEYLNFRTEDIGGRNISFQFGGWARVDLADEIFNKRTDNDLQYAYLSFRKNTGNSALNLGRFFVHDGAISDLIDGAYARTDLVGGFGVSAFGGVPVDADFDGRNGDSAYGGRISQGYPGRYQIGVSYLKERNNNTDFREEKGADIWLHPANKIEILGTSSYNDLTKNWMQHDYFFTLGPFANLSIRSEASYVSYKDYFTAATMSAFFFGPSGIPNPDEKLSTIGGALVYAAGGVVASADYKKYHYEIAGNGDYYGANLSYSLPNKWSAGAALHRMNGESDNLKYYESRIYGYKKFARADLTADLVAVLYDMEINGIKNAFSASVAAGYFIADKIKIAGDVEYAHNPFFDKEVRGLIKLVWNFGNPYETNRSTKK